MRIVTKIPNQIRQTNIALVCNEMNLKYSPESQLLKYQGKWPIISACFKSFFYFYS